MEYTDLKYHSYEKRFVESNRGINKKELYDSEDRILVYHSLRGEFSFSLLEDIVARQIQESVKMDILSIQYAGFSRKIEKLDESFNIKPLYIDWDSERINEEGHEELRKREDILELQYSNIRIGDVVYDEMLRFYGLSVDYIDTFDLDKLNEKIDLAVRIIDIANVFFKANRIKYLVMTEWGYLNGLFARVAQEYGVIIFISSIEYPQYVGYIMSQNRLYDDVKTSDCICGRIEKMYEMSEDIVATSNFFVFNQEDDSELKVTNNKPNAVILTHALIDNPRNGAHMTAFIDFYEWLDYTLNAASKIKEVNWYLKDHPRSTMYGQDKIIKEIFDKYSCDNIIWIDKKYCGESIKKIADCVLTCSGDAGIEYWACGIPTITAARGYYVDWGISYNANSKEDYTKLLKSVANLEKPDDRTVIMAQKMLSSLSMESRVSNPIIRIIQDFRKKQLQRFSSGDFEAYDLHYELCEKLIELFDSENQCDYVYKSIKYEIN